MPSGDADADAGNPMGDTSATDAAPELDPCIGWALHLDGTTYARLLRPVQDDFTIELWIRTTSSLSGTVFYNGRGVIDGDVVGGSADDYSTRILNDHFVVGTGNPDVTLEGTSSVISGEWVHVAATRRASNGQMQIIVNGVLESSAVFGKTGPLDDALTLTVGGAIDGFRFVGEMDEVRFWDVVRTPEEIRASMHEPLSDGAPGLVRHYRFEDANGTVAADSLTSEGATFVGTPSFVPSTVLCTAP